MIQKIQHLNATNNINNKVISFTYKFEYMSLANKYRPKSFQDVIGQSHIIDILQAKIAKHNNNSHNYIFYGPRGTGKTSTARLFAKAINAISIDENGNPSQNDPNVTAIDAGTTLDYVEIDAASHTGVDNIREEILAKVPYPPTMLKKKVYVIDEVHMLSTGAFNALLKTIEEPKDYVVFILATTEIHKVPDTIISRCQVFNFKKVPESEMINHLAHIAEQEHIPYEREALGLIAGISDGCIRDAVKYLDQVSILGNIDVAHASKFLSVASEKMITDFLQALQSKDRTTVFGQIDNIQQAGVDLYNFAKQLLQHIDKHLMEHIDDYLAISQVCNEILSTIRYYPYPAIVYKIACNKYVDPETTTPTIETKINTTPSIKTEDINNPKDKDKKEDKGENDTAQPPVNENNMNDIKHQLLAKIDKQSLRDNLKENIQIHSIKGNIVHIITISSMANMLLQKQETIQYLEKILEEILERPVSLSSEFIKKEDYLQSMI